MAGIQDILSMLPVEDIAKKLGVDPDVAAQAVREGGSAILGGLGRNAETGDGAAAIEGALAKHTDATLDPNQVDTADGQKILGHIFGGREEAVSGGVSQASGLNRGQSMQVMMMLAPLVMQVLGKMKRQQGLGAQDVGGRAEGADLALEVGELGAVAQRRHGADEPVLAQHLHRAHDEDAPAPDDHLVTGVVAELADEHLP